MCGWFTSELLIITIHIESCGSPTFTNRSLRRPRSITSKCSHITRTSTHREVVKTRMWIGHNIIGGHRTSPGCLSRRRDRTILSNIMLIWDGIIRDEWLQNGTEWILRNNWVSQYRTPRSLWMNWHTYHTHTIMPERLEFNQTICSYLSFSHNLWYRIKKNICRCFV
jgi:hypothetical protein